MAPDDERNYKAWIEAAQSRTHCAYTRSTGARDFNPQCGLFVTLLAPIYPLGQCNVKTAVKSRAVLKSYPIFVKTGQDIAIESRAGEI